MKSRLLSISAVVCLSLMLTSGRLGVAQPLETIEQDPAWLSQMLQEGWQKVEKGVLQRDEGGGQVEIFTYGKEGQAYRIARLEEHISFLEHEYNTNPTEELADVIDTLKGELAQSSASLDAAPSAEEFDGDTVLLNCDFSFGGHAYANPLSGAQAPGVTSRSDAYFHNNCGYLGNTFAYAYSQAAIGSTLTTKTQQDPKNNSTWIDSYATTSVSGTSQCHSWAYAEVTSYSLGISYFVPRVDNYACPNPPTVTVTTPTDYYYTDYNWPCVDVTWTANVSGGTAPFTYNWYIGTAYQGSGSTLTKTYCSQSATVTARAVVSDGAGQSAEGSKTVWISHDPGDPCTMYGDCGCQQDPWGPRQICPYYN